MSSDVFTHDQIVHQGQFSTEDIAEIQKRRRDNNRLGFAYHLAFVRLTNSFPAQQPLEIVDELLSYVSIQVDKSKVIIEQYEQRQQTMAEHRSALLDYLKLHRFGEQETKKLEWFIFGEASRLEQTGPHLMQAKAFLKNNTRDDHQHPLC